MDFNIEVEGDFQELLRVGDLAKEVVGWTRVLPNEVVREINTLLREQIIDSSQQSKDATGKKFVDLKDNYARVKDSYGYPDKADLHFTDRAFDSFYIERDASGPSARNRSIAHFKDEKQSTYMNAHQTGAENRKTVTRKANPLPQRKFFPEDDDLNEGHYAKFREDVERILTDYLRRLEERRNRRG